jgi:amino acid adenylation domain-containing protein
MTPKELWKSMENAKTQLQTGHLSDSYNGDGATSSVNFVQNRFVHQMVSAQVASRRDATAVVSGNSRLSYGELDERANRLAQHFRSIGLGPETVVALWLRRSPYLIVSALAALKAGAAYLPLDPEIPVDRLLYMVHDCGAKLVVTESVLAEQTWHVQCPVLIFDQASEAVSRFEPRDPDVELSPDSVAYVIYTSGSTGTPKGVEITHANLTNLISWHNRAFQVHRADHASHLAGLGFDASVWETWPYLAAGASLYLIDSHTLHSHEALRSWLIANEISISFVPTPLAESLIGLPWPAETKLRVLLTGGDTLHMHPASGLPFTLVNNYGPTECTVVATSGVVSPSTGASPPAIGASIDNAKVYILNEQLQPVGTGNRGELYIGGANVGRGYRNRPQLTSQRFIPNPFIPGTKMYKTGDLGTYLPDGNIAFLGRADNQVKIRGYRIEPDEIAAVLNSYPGVTTSVVMARADGGEDKRLVAYIVARWDLTLIEVQEFLLKRLPQYMVPSAYVLIEDLPLTSNGKVDSAALPLPTPENRLGNKPSETNSAIENSLGQVVADLLNIPEFGPDDNFFLLGGHSLLGTQLIARIRDRFDVEITLRALFEKPTVRELAGEVERLLVAKVEEMSEEEAKRELSASANAPAVGDTAA